MKISFFHRKPEERCSCPEGAVPAIRCSICTGEQVAGFRYPETGRFEEVTLLRGEEDLAAFKNRYGITGKIEKIY